MHHFELEGQLEEEKSLLTGENAAGLVDDKRGADTGEVTGKGGGFDDGEAAPKGLMELG